MGRGGKYTAPGGERAAEKSQFRYRYNARRKRWPKHLGAAEIRMNAQVWPNSGQWGGDGATFPGHLAAMPDEGPGGRRRGGAPGQWRSQGSLVDGHTSHARRFPSASMPPPAACALSFVKLRHRAQEPSRYNLFIRSYNGFL